MGSIGNEVASNLESELNALWRFALKLTTNPDDAADLVQRTCLKALEKQQTYNRQGRLRSWLFSIEHRIWLNELRSRHLRSSDQFDTVTGAISATLGTTISVQDSGLSESPETNVLLEQVYDLVEALPEAQKMVMLLVYVEGFSYRETADILDVPIGTIMSRLARARVVIGQYVLSDTCTFISRGKSEAV